MVLLLKAISVLFGVVLLCSALGSVDAADVPKGVEYEAIVNRVPADPVVCIVEFEDDKIDDVVTQRIVQRVHDGILNWETLLKNSESHPKYWYKWDMSVITIPVDQKESYDYTTCDVVIKLEGQPGNDVPRYTVLGYATTDKTPTEIVIFYRQVQVISSSDQTYEYWNYVYSDEPRLPIQIGNVARHEFGHALGLGHYKYDFVQGNKFLSTLGKYSPSVMVPLSPDVVGEQWIKTIDLEAIKQIYGEDGFFSQSDVFASFFVSQPKYVVDYDQVQFVTLSGTIANDGLNTGQTVLITMTDPFGNKEKLHGYIVDNDQFSAQIRIDDDAPRGIYSVVAEYLDAQSEPVIFAIVDSDDAEPPQSIPDWIKNNAAWWGDEMIGDSEFISGIEYLVKQKIIDVPPAASVAADSDEIPDWIRSNATWWADGLIDDDTFVSTIQYLIHNGIIVI